MAELKVNWSACGNFEDVNIYENTHVRYVYSIVWYDCISLRIILKNTLPLNVKAQANIYTPI